MSKFADLEKVFGNKVSIFLYGCVVVVALFVIANNIFGLEVYIKNSVISKTELNEDYISRKKVNNDYISKKDLVSNEFNPTDVLDNLDLLINVGNGYINEQSKGNHIEDEVNSWKYEVVTFISTLKLDKTFIWKGLPFEGNKMSTIEADIRYIHLTAKSPVTVLQQTIGVLNGLKKSLKSRYKFDK